MQRYFKRVLFLAILAVSGMVALQAQNNFVRHTVVSGETLYRLSVKYGVTVEQIVRANPDLSGGVMKAGMQLVIPTAVPNAQANGAAKPVYQATHKVERKETLWAISQKYGVTPEEIIAANPDVFAKDNKLRKGALLNIPYPAKKQEAKADVQPVQKKKLPAEENETVVEEVELPVATKVATPVVKKAINNYDTLRIAVVLPFTDKKPVTPLCVDFYRGLLMAVDSMKNTGANIRVTTFNETEDATAISLIKGKLLAAAPHIIFGPAYVNHIDELGEFACTMPCLKWVLHFSSKYNMIKYNENAFLVNAPDENKAANTVELITRVFKSVRVAFFNEPGANETVFTAELRNILMLNQIEVVDLPADCTLEQMQSLLSADKETLFVPSISTKQGGLAVLEKMGMLRDAVPEAQFSTLGYPDWILETTNKERAALHKADTYVTTAHFYNPGNKNTRKFITDFKANFKSKPISFSPVTSLLGYDTGFYFMKGIKTHGAAFNTQKIVAPYLQTKLHFEPTLPGGGFVNASSYFIHYSTDNKVTRVTGK